MKTPKPLPDLRVYKWKVNARGKPVLYQWTMPNSEAELQASAPTLEQIAIDYVRHQDTGVLGLLAAGSATALYFAAGLHKKTYRTRERFTKECLGRSGHTVRDWIYSSGIYTEIGGLAAVQPTNIYQLVILKKILPAYRQQGWIATSSANGGGAPTGAALLEWAESHDALIAKPVKKERYVVPELPLGNSGEAALFIRHLKAQAEFRQDHGLVTALEMLAIFETKQSATSIAVPPKPTKRKRRKKGAHKDTPRQLPLNYDANVKRIDAA